MLNLVLLLSLSHTGHWKFNMAPHCKKLSEDLKQRLVALHKDGVGYKKIAKTLKLSCSTVAKTIQRFNSRFNSSLTEQVPLRTGLAMVDQRSCSAWWWECHGLGCMSAAGTVEIQFIEGTMNANMYCDILKQSMIPSLRRLSCRAGFQHDNDHCLAKEAEGKGDGLAKRVSRPKHYRSSVGILKQKEGGGAQGL